MVVTVDPEKREKKEKYDTIIEDEGEEKNLMIDAVCMNYKFCVDGLYKIFLIIYFFFSYLLGY
jgi:hypothetical protein